MAEQPLTGGILHGTRGAAHGPDRRTHRARSCLALALFLCLPATALAEPWVAPGDARLRHDLELLNDSGAMHLPLTAWPLSWDDIARGLDQVDPARLSPGTRAAWERLSAERERASGEPRLELSASLAEAPRRVRGFAALPRDEAEAGAAFAWSGARLAVRLQGTLVADPVDGDEVRPDGSYVGLTLGNWMLSAGWQDRWWGPGRDGSLILSTSARPTPGFAIQRRTSTPFETRWLRWIGPWSFSAFMTELDDERVIDDARLLGMRVNFRPLAGLEIGLSRTAQWCGEGRPCDFSTLTDLLLGNDNRGVNVDPDAEPGNQLAGIDLRWRLPRQVPLALYMQWIGEDTRQGGPEIGSWLRQVGIEHWGRVGGLVHRSHFEVSDTECREGGFGFAEHKPDCAYEHGTYRTGYRYLGRSLGHGADGDGLIYTFGSTLVQSAGHSWNVSVRHMEVNRSGTAAAQHTISATAQDVSDFLLTHERLMQLGRLRIGLGYRRLEDLSGTSSDDVEAFIGWSSH
jgi:hypothetical protein